MPEVRKIKEEMERQGVTAYEIAINTGISESTIGRILSRKTKKPNTRTLQVIESYLQVDRTKEKEPEEKIMEVAKYVAENQEQLMQDSLFRAVLESIFLRKEFTSLLKKFDFLSKKGNLD